MRARVKDWIIGSGVGAGLVTTLLAGIYFGEWWWTHYVGVNVTHNTLPAIVALGVFALGCGFLRGLVLAVAEVHRNEAR